MKVIWLGNDARAIATLVGTVLIILITMSAAGIVGGIVVPLVKTNLDFGRLCSEAKITINMISGYSCVYEEINKVGIMVSRGVGEFNLSGIQVIIKGGGKTESVDIMGSLKNPNEEVTYVLSPALDKIEEIGVAPIVKVGNNEKRCRIVSKISGPSLPRCPGTTAAGIPIEPGASCSDGIQNQDETGVDCGGTCISGAESLCSDGVDNDKDCLIDLADSDCAPPGECEGQPLGTDCSGFCMSCDGSGNCISTLLGMDYQNECGNLDCSPYVSGWGGADEKSCYAKSSMHDSLCDGSGACESLADACGDAPAENVLATCGSAECKRDCPSGASSTDYDSVAEICYTSGQNGCAAGYICDATGTCIGASCSDGIQNGDETGVDCGGSCISGTESLCSDGLDNDDDCLIDGADPDCISELNEDFSSGSDGWTLTGGGWSVTAGELRQNNNVLFSSAVYNSSINLSSGNNYNISMKAYDDDNDGSGIIFRYSSSTHYYRCISYKQNGYSRIERIDGGTTTLASSSRVYIENAYNYYSVSIINGNISCYLNGRIILSSTDSSWEEGRVGIYNSYHQNARYDDFIVDML